MGTLTPLTTEIKETLYQRACEARLQSYSPYSGYAVGASVLFDDAHIESGANIENSSFGATVCAERVAIWSGIKAKCQRRIVAFCVVTDNKPPWPPCGLCRQVAREFIEEDAWVLLAHPSDGIIQIWRFSELFPVAFSPQQLKK